MRREVLPISRVCTSVFCLSPADVPAWRSLTLRGHDENVLRGPCDGKAAGASARVQGFLTVRMSPRVWLYQEHGGGSAADGGFATLFELDAEFALGFRFQP